MGLLLFVVLLCSSITPKAIFFGFFLFYCFRFSEQFGAFFWGFFADKFRRSFLSDFITFFGLLGLIFLSAVLWAVYGFILWSFLSFFGLFPCFIFGLFYLPTNPVNDGEWGNSSVHFFTFLLDI